MSARADFQWRLEDFDGQRVVLIVDNDLGNMSVTNDVEAVLEDIDGQTMGQGIAGAEVYYRDSQGQWDEIILDAAGKFVTFAPAVPLLRESLKITWGET